MKQKNSAPCPFCMTERKRREEVESAARRFVEASDRRWAFANKIKKGNGSREPWKEISDHWALVTHEEQDAYLALREVLHEKE